ncbi:MAG TPA: response regulator [Anaerolineales bacterium]|nr:response regulator [Anaerolineales bacterium]
MTKVLLAEDDRTMVSLLTTLLRMEGYDVATLSADMDVLTALQHEKPEVLFMDVHLGKQNGMEIIDAIRRDPALAKVRIIMASGMNLKEECLQRGADHFILKPFMPDDLLSLLKQNNSS